MTALFLSETETEMTNLILCAMIEALKIDGKIAVAAEEAK